MSRSALVTEDGGRVGRLDVTFQAAPVAQAFIADPTKVTALFGPLGSAKTTDGVFKGYFYGQRHPGARIAVIRDTWPNLRDTTQKTFFEWFPENVAGVYRRTEKTFRMWTANGKPIEFIFRAMDDKADISNVLSLDLAAAWIDEPQGGLALRPGGEVVREPGIDHDLYLAILGRLGRQAGDYPPMLWLTGNPPPRTHWIAREFRYDPGQSGCAPPTNQRPDFRLYLADRETNRHHLRAGYYEDLEEWYGVGTPMHRRFVLGHWIEFGTEQPFRPDWITYYGDGYDVPAPNLSELDIAAGFDPAISQKDTAARSALVVAGQMRRGLYRGVIFVLYAEAGHWSPYEQADHILKAVVRHKIRTVRIEDVAYQKALADILDREAQQRGIAVHIEVVRPDGDKVRRANAWSGLVQTARVVFGPGQKDLVDSLCAVPMDRMKWDLVDAAGIVVRGFAKLGSEKQTIPGQERSTPTLAKSYAIRPRTTTPRPTTLAPSRTPIRVLPNRRDPRQRAMGYAVRRRPRIPTPGSGVLV